MISISKEQIENTFDVKNLYVGNITMYLDEKHRGEVIITFADEKEDLVRYLARFNTAEHVFNNIEYCSNGSKLDSAPISVDEWKIDSTEAIAISANAFAEEDNFKYDKVYVTSSMRFYDSKEFWNVHFTNSNMKIVYDVRIDVYTGDIASKLIRHIR